MSAETDAAFDELGVEVTAITSAAKGAIVVMNAFPDRVLAAVAKALADNPGITPAQLQGIKDEATSMKGAAADLAAAVVANTPAA